MLLSSNGWRSYILENLLALKYLHNRGFNLCTTENNLADGFLTEFLSILFGEENVEWEPGAPEEALPDLDTLDEDSEEYYILDQYYSRSHYLIRIRIEALSELQPQHNNKLLCALRTICPSEEDIELEGGFPWYEMFRSINWLQEDGIVTGLLIHFVDIEHCCDEEPILLGNYLDAFIRFWDQMQNVNYR